MNKFELNLMSSNEGIKKTRGKTLANQAERAKRKVIESVQEEIEQKEFELERLNDLSPKQTTDLAYRDDFNPQNWAERTSELEVKIYTLKIRLNILEKSYDKWFKKQEGGNDESISK